MKTDDLIRALTKDLADPGPSIEARFAAAFMPGVLVAVILFAVTLGPRPDFMAATGDMRFVFKFVITLLLALCSAMLVWRLVRPGASTRLQIAALVLVPIVLAGAVVAELVALPRPLWTLRLVGVNGLTCLLSIPFFAAPLLIAAIFALRHGAPTRPGVTGVVAGLFSGAVAAAIYAAHCPDDSPLFVALWYSIAIAVVAVVGGIAGRVALRW
jgi:hypothetical protein